MPEVSMKFINHAGTLPKIEIGDRRGSPPYRRPGPLFYPNTRCRRSGHELLKLERGVSVDNGLRAEVLFLLKTAVDVFRVDVVEITLTERAALGGDLDMLVR